jgi:ribosomal-protein-alanine N-acetyltransferase
MSGEVRRMQLADLPEVLRNELGGYTYSWTEGIFRDCLRNGQECWLLMCGDQNVGHGILSVAAGEAHLLNVCVHPDFQGNGFGLGERVVLKPSCTCRVRVYIMPRLPQRRR